MPATNYDKVSRVAEAERNRAECPHCDADLTKPNSVTALDRQRGITLMGRYKKDTGEVIVTGMNPGTPYYDLGFYVESRDTPVCVTCDHVLKGW